MINDPSGILTHPTMSVSAHTTATQKNPSFVTSKNQTTTCYMDPSKKSSTTPPVTSTPTAPIGNSSALFPNLNHVKTPKPLLRHESPRVRKMEAEMQEEFIFTEDRFLSKLRTYHSFDVATYTIMSFALFRKSPIRRLIYGVGIPPLGTALSVHVSHTHAKLWLCYKSPTDNSPDVYVGSANATDMTILDLMIKVNSRQAKTLIGYFNLLWELNYKGK